MSANVGKIKQLLDENFEIKGDIIIHPDTGIVDVVGEKINVFVKLKAKTKIKNLPVQFGRVDGFFGCSDNQLTSLQGAPTSVGGSFNCDNNQLTSLVHAPISVDGNFTCEYNKLTSLQGVPKSIKGTWFITVYPNTPLLRLLLIQGIKNFLFMDPNGNDDINELNSLFQKYYPQGRQGILKCGLEMMSIENGKYATNARMGPP